MNDPETTLNQLLDLWSPTTNRGMPTNIHSFRQVMNQAHQDRLKPKAPPEPKDPAGIPPRKRGPGRPRTSPLPSTAE